MRFPVLGLVAALTLAACEGAQGPQGLTGPPGPTGPSGPAGPPGNANVQSTTFDYGDSTCDIEQGIAGCVFDWTAITPSVVNEGVVFAYLNSAGNWFAMPLTLGRDDNGDGEVDQTLEYSYSYREGQVTFIVRFGSAPVSSVGSGTIRVVAIDGPSPFTGTTPPPFELVQQHYSLAAE